MSTAERTMRAGPWVLGGFLAMGLVLAIWHPAGLDQLFEWGRWLAARPVFLVLLVVVMVAMFTFALPATLFVWLLAPFHPPLLTVAILLTGSVLGALSAYGLAYRLGQEWQLGVRTRRVMGLLARRSDLVTQCALRILPGFPHAVVNYAGGILRLPLPVFLAAAGIGLSIKWGVYATAIHRGMGALERGELVDGWDLLPLAILALLLLLGNWAQRSLRRRHGEPRK